MKQKKIVKSINRKSMKRNKEQIQQAKDNEEVLSWFILFLVIAFIVIFIFL